MIDAPSPPRESAPPLRIPEPALLFQERAARLEALAPSSAPGDFLLLLARMARGQARAAREVPVAGAAPAGGPTPVAPARVPRQAAWRRMLGLVLEESRAGAGMPEKARRAIRHLEDGGSAVEALADAVLAGRVTPEVAPDALATAPFVAAALQAFYGALAAGVDPAAVPPAERGCPACGSPPIAGIVRGDDRARYVACALCAAQWYVPRIRCTSCGEGRAVSYFEIEQDPGTRAEACDACKRYLKLFDLAKRPGAELLADDVATLALDLLLAEQGYARGGVNPLLWSAG